MDITTRVSKEWKKRQIIIASLLAALGGWFYYDGAIDYPRKNVRYDQFTAWEAEGKTAEQTEALARERGWPAKKPEKRYSDSYLVGQFVMGHASVAGALAAAVWLALAFRRSPSADAEAAYGANGTRVPFAAIREIDRRKWENKGIAYALYEIGGRRGRLTLDDYKYQGAEAIIRRAEEAIAARDA
jgi:hypothetical protein